MPRPALSVNIAELLLRTARQFPDRPALYRGARQVADYAALCARVARLAATLRGPLGLCPGDRVALYMNNCPAYLECLQAIWWAGLAAVPVNARLHPRELAYILADSGAAAVLVSDALASAVPAGTRNVLPADGAGYERLLATQPLPLEPRAPADLAWLFYTSGTTGQPKGVMLTHRNVLAMTWGYFTDVDTVSAGDATVYAAPFSHGAGIYNLPFVLRGARHVVPESGGFDPAELVALSRAVGSLCLFAAPTMVRRLVDVLEHDGTDPSGFRTLVYGGGPMYEQDIRRALQVMGNRLVQIYGQGESPMTITCLSRSHLAAREHPRWARRIASVGVAHSVVEVRVAGEDGTSLPAGEVGEVLVRGDTVMAGYWGNPEATARTVREGWLWTGDLGSLDEDGFLTLRDRSRDLIISGGSNIYPREVEEVLLRHPGVQEVSVVGRHDPEWGETVVAFVVGAGVPAAELDALCLDHMARFKRPREYRFVDSLPKNNYGKVLKTALRALLESSADAGP